MAGSKKTSMKSVKRKNDRKYEGGNHHLDRILAIYPDDQEIFMMDGRVILMPKGTTLEEAQEHYKEIQENE